MQEVVEVSPQSFGLKADTSAAVGQLVYAASFLMHPALTEPITAALSPVSYNILRVVPEASSEVAPMVTGLEVMKLSLTS